MWKITKLRSLAAYAYALCGLWHPENEVGLNVVRGLKTRNTQVFLKLTVRECK